MNIRNEIKAQIVRAGFTMQELVDRLSDEYDWSVEDPMTTATSGLDSFAIIIYSLRSEERRVGKECRSRWSPYH